MRALTATFAFAAFATTLLVGSIASADLVPDGKTYAPLKLTLDGQAAFADTTFVVLGCNSTGGGRHQIAFAKATEPLECGIKLPPTVYAVPTKDVKPLQDLFAKDLGWASEGIEARKLLEKAMSCGTINEATMVDKSKNVSFLTARYALAKASAGCSIAKVGETITTTSSSASATDVTPSASASASPAPSSSSSAAAPAAKGGCGSCATSQSHGSTSPILVMAGAIAIAVLRRRKIFKPGVARSSTLDTRAWPID